MWFYFQRTFSSSLLKDSIPNLDFVPNSETIFFFIYYIFMEVSPSEKFVRGWKKPQTSIRNMESDIELYKNKENEKMCFVDISHFCLSEFIVMGFKHKEALVSPSCIIKY